ncbi:murein hydrolase activator EnvC family protein [Calditrichota bacterium]
MKYCAIIMITFIFFNLNAQTDLDSQLRDNRNQLEKVKSQITNLQDEITKAKIKSSNLLKQAKYIDKEMGLITEVKRLLYNKNKLLLKKINSTQAELKDKKNILANLKKQYISRTRHLYKYGKIKNLDLLLSSESLNQAMVRFKYLKLFAEQESKTINKIKAEVTAIEQLNKELNITLNQQKSTLQIKEKEEQRYVAKRDEKRILLRKLKWNKDNLTKQLKDAEQDYQKLNSIIIALEKKRKERERTKTVKPEYALKLKNFSKSKGQLFWPVDGKVISKYGKQKNQVLKTYVNNTGIDIKAKIGTEAKAVFQGIVSMITYLGGYGNTLIIDHGQGYYTVYSHLSDIMIEEDQYVHAGDTVGLVGDSGSLEGAKLHFEIYANEKTVNPLKWLR